MRSLACAHQSVTKAIAEACGVSLLTSLLGPFPSHSVGSEAVAILVSGVPLDADAKAALMQPAKVSSTGTDRSQRIGHMNTFNWLSEALMFNIVFMD